ncbi:SSU ribosomal protein S18P alanine acetyltransferase [Sulfurimonas denitrificans DSM 1251]|uniref:[Ribosomal protein bS18]-alanine N-acetyltransferase n=1 Tax=Sulfurimonas denitrificans (strain ATCC 33889 / DSM 1251) TaxID=326298 RepID=Q30RA2_SULDN|nr:ribosomal protein S18-alanine N-acetyltransferase [Sulfurimonas denitrificans]ABB44479.1 SSU ribosomal protein S18P alanine acetyltransferase [Sulfurimonas denitrificans DSM 1251]MDD3441661.1 ribosomal protein S18-alanine N-acetyltransferase [Sulfurimonas denitrificans]
MKIRKAELSDSSELFALEQKLFLSKNYPLSRGSFCYHIKNNMLFVAEIDNIIAGYILVLIKRKNAKLYSIGVKEEFRGRKIAQKLLEFSIKKLSSIGFDSLLLEVRVDNEVAINLYKKIGFSIKKNLNEFYLDGCDAYLMEL